MRNIERRSILKSKDRIIALIEDKVKDSFVEKEIAICDKNPTMWDYLCYLLDEKVVDESNSCNSHIAYYIGICSGIDLDQALQLNPG